MPVWGDKTYDADWFEIDAMGRRLTGQKDWAANADWAAATGGQNPYTNQAGASEYDKSGFIPGNEPGSTLPKGPAPGGYLDYSRMAAYQQSLTAPKATATPAWSAPSAPTSFASSWAPSSPATASGGDPASQIRNAYSQYLGRPASEAEVQGWTSGSFGGGGLVEWIQQIQNSDEARQRGQTVPTLGQNPDVSHGYSDPATRYGVPPEVYQATGYGTPESGYGPGGVENPAYTGPGSPSYGQAGVDPNFAAQLNSAYQTFLGRTASPDEINNWWSGAYGYGQGMSGLPAFTNVIQNSDEARARQGGATGAPAATGGPQGGQIQPWFQSLVAGKPPSPQSLKALEPILNQYGIKLGPNNARGFTDGIILQDGTFVDVIEAATATGGKAWAWMIPTGAPGGVDLPGGQYNDPYTGLLEEMLKQRIGGLQGGVNDPNAAAYQNALRNRAGALGAGNQQLDQLLGYLQERFTDLQGPGYTGAENEVLRTQALDPIEQDRAAAKKRVMESLSARGMSPDDGTYQAAMLEVDNAFDAMRGETQTSLASSELSRRENRSQRAELLGAQLVDIPEARSREQLDVYSAIEMLSRTLRGEDDARQREALGYAGTLSDLGPQRLQLALQAMGAGGDPSSLGSSLFNMANLNQNAAYLNQRNSGSLWSGLGSIAAILSQAGR